ncbi:hypothetical protein [Mangrovibacterium lignilyticum]|uniref:hypothetical protein n=1 Tax=Mangrovibacterium lignilyticum TaxID=2668052 RepID=UPI0013CFF78D|nr:hypothetical protein [Mangrovibacterium lignilyticum]
MEIGSRMAGGAKHRWKRLRGWPGEANTDGNAFADGRARQTRMEIASRTVGRGKHAWKRPRQKNRSFPSIQNTPV